MWPAQRRQSAGDPISPNCQVIEVHVAELNQLFNAIDPAPFRQRDLDPDAEEFIVGWAREIPADAPLALDVQLDRPAGLPEEAAILRDAIREFFGQRARGVEATPSSAIPTRTHEPRDWHHVSWRIVVGGRHHCAVARRTARRRDLARKSAHWRLGRHVAPDGDISVRLVANPSGCSTRRQAERDARENLLQNGRERGSLAFGLARCGTSDEPADDG
jgi:hypothetical protein